MASVKKDKFGKQRNLLLIKKLGNLIAIVDANGLQIDGKVEDVCSSGSLNDKFAAFGWEVYEANGHDIDELIKLFMELKTSSSDAPKVVIAHTIKGKGVSFPGKPQ